MRGGGEALSPLKAEAPPDPAWASSSQSPVALILSSTTCPGPGPPQPFSPPPRSPFSLPTSFPSWPLCPARAISSPQNVFSLSSVIICRLPLIFLQDSSSPPKPLLILPGLADIPSSPRAPKRTPPFCLPKQPNRLSPCPPPSLRASDGEVLLSILFIGPPAPTTTSCTERVLSKPARWLVTLRTGGPAAF